MVRLGNSIAIAITALLLPILTNLISSELTIPSQEKLGKEHYLLIITLITVVVFIAATAFEKWKKKQEANTPIDLLNSEQRLLLIQSLEKRYHGRIGKQADSEYQIDLQYAYSVEGLNHVQQSLLDDHARKEGLTNETLPDLFFKHKFLILLGEAGSGKTTSLISLALKLLDNARQDTNAPVPILFNLASWTEEYSEFEKWLEQILHQSYGYSLKHAAAVIRELQIIPLMDGLDEIGKNLPDNEARIHMQQKCLVAIDKYQQLNNTPWFVICSRKQEYFTLTERGMANISLFVKAQIRIEPITHNHVQHALIRLKEKNDIYYASGKSVRALLPHFKARRDIQEALCNPFYFNLALQVFGLQDNGKQFDFTNQTTSFKDELVKLYASKITDTQKTNVTYKKEDVNKWLIWLAQWISTRGEDSFELSDLQPDQLKNKKAFTIGICLLFGLTLGVLLGSLISIPTNIKTGVCFGLLASICISWFATVLHIFTSGHIKIKSLAPDMKWNWWLLRKRKTWLEISIKAFPQALILGIFIGIVYNKLIPGILGGFIIFIIFFITETFNKVSPYAKWGANNITERKNWEWQYLRRQKTWKRLIYLSVPSSIAIAFLLYFDNISSNLLYSFMWAQIVILPIGILVVAAPQRIYKRIETREIRKWQWKMIYHSKSWDNILLYWIICSFLLGSIAWIIERSIPVKGLEITLLVVFGTTVLVLLKGIAEIIDAFSKEFGLFLAIKDPYQRLRGSLINNIMRSVFGCTVCAAALIVAYSNQPWAYILLKSILLGSMCGISYSLVRSPLIEHFILNYCLLLEKAMPFPYVKFLDYCTELQILGSDGGSYRFRHQILLEYYYELGKTVHDNEIKV